MSMSCTQIERSARGRVACGASVAILVCCVSGCAMRLPRRGEAIAPVLPDACECRLKAGTDELIRVDGVFEEDAWNGADTLPAFRVPGTDRAPAGKTVAKVLWDEHCLYLAFRAFDQDVWSVFRDRDADTAREDSLEVFLRTSPAADGYYRIAANALGTVADAFHYRAGVGMAHRWNRWDCEGVEVAVTVAGTLNDWDDKDEYWQLEMAIPFRALPSLKGRGPTPGDRWFFHAGRHDRSVYLETGHEMSSCAPLATNEFHDRQGWLPLDFVTEPPLVSVR